MRHKKASTNHSHSRGEGLICGFSAVLFNFPLFILFLFAIRPNVHAEANWSRRLAFCYVMKIFDYNRTLKKKKRNRIISVQQKKNPSQQRPFCCLFHGLVSAYPIEIGSETTKKKRSAEKIRNFRACEIK